MNEFEFEVLDLEEEEVIEKATKCERLCFPAVYVCGRSIYFNKRCRDLFDKEHIKVSKSTNLICFRPSDNGYKKSAGRSSGFTISGANIRTVTCLPVGKTFRLYKLKDGGYAIKRYEPIAEET